LFLAKFKTIVAPVLQEEGFRGSGNNFRRQTKEVIHVLNVQGSRYGGKCWINMGIHLTFLPTVVSRIADPKKITEPDCEFRTRLHYPDAVDTSWPYRNSDEEDERSALSIKKIYLDVGRNLFSQFLVFPDDFTKVTPEDFVGQKLGLCSPTFMITKTRALLAQARIYEHIGNQEFASRFAKMALVDLGRAVGLRAELERLARP
jgi:hypothetical protein